MGFESAFDLVPLGSLADFVNGDRGVNYPRPTDYVEKGVPFISATDIDGGRVSLSSVKRISRDAFQRLRSGHVRRDDVLLCLRGSLGKLGLVSEFDEGAIASSLVILRATHPAMAGYLRYLLSSTPGREALGALDNGSVQGNISAGALKRLLVPLPPMRVREELVETLSAFDTRMDLLHQTNTTLEFIAQALFKSWFIDFDPVRAKQAGREPQGMDAATAALFPTEFEQSAIGRVPAGWKPRTIEELAAKVGMGPFGSNIKVSTFVESGVPVLQ